MKITLLPEKNTVTIDNRRAVVDLSHLAEIAAVQWDGAVGTVELVKRAFVGTDEEGPIVHRITDISRFQAEIDTATAIFDVIDNPPPLPIEGLRRVAVMTVNAKAGQARAPFITTDHGQEATYAKKAMQAQAMLAEISAANEEARDPDLVEDEYRLIFNEVGITGNTAQEVAEIVLQRHADWEIAEAEIERVRKQANFDIARAEDTAGVDAVLAGLAWPVLPA